MNKTQKICLAGGLLSLFLMCLAIEIDNIFMFIFCFALAVVFFVKIAPKRKKNISAQPESAFTDAPVSKKKKPTTERKYKGKRLETFVDDFTIIDLETTGFSPKDDKIIELSAIKVRNNEEIETYTTLINPGMHIPSKITNLTSITDDMVADAPKIEDAIQQFVDFIGNDIVVGHNVNFDINFVYDRYLEVSGKTFSNEFIDTLYIARKALPELEHHRLSDLAEHYGIINENAHRSLSDCQATHEVYNALRNK